MLREIMLKYQYPNEKRRVFLDEKNNIDLTAWYEDDVVVAIQIEGIQDEIIKVEGVIGKSMVVRFYIRDNEGETSKDFLNQTRAQLQTKNVYSWLDKIKIEEPLDDYIRKFLTQY